MSGFAEVSLKSLGRYRWRQTALHTGGIICRYARADSDGDDASPIYRNERVAIGQLQGRAILNHDGLRSRIHAFKKGVGGLAAVRSRDTNAISTSDLRKAFKALDEQHEDANRAISEVNRAHLFFSQDNVERIANWADQNTSARVQNEGGRLIVNGTELSLGPIARLQAISAIRPD